MENENLEELVICFQIKDASEDNMINQANK